MASLQRSMSWFGVALAPLCMLLAAYMAFEMSRPDILLVGNITVDLVDGTTPTGGAVSYAAVLAHALHARTCVVTVAGPEADLTVFNGSDLNVIPASETLTFEHTYTWWGHSRKLRVTANPNITIAKAHVPLRCRFARVVLLGPLTLHDVDAASFAQHDGFWDRLLNPGQLVGLMAQGFQRDLGPDGQVLPLPAPSQRLLDGLGSRVSLFLSDVETDTWSQQQLQSVTASAARVIITQGDKGALLIQNGAAGGSSSSSSNSSSSGSSGSPPIKIPAVKVPTAVDTNGAGDTFATTFMIAMMRGDQQPGTTAAWAASRAVMQPQTCKPQCAPALITSSPDVIPLISHQERLKMVAAPLLQRLQVVAAEPLKGAGKLLEVGWVRQFFQGLGIRGLAAGSGSADGASSSSSSGGGGSNSGR